MLRHSNQLRSPTDRPSTKEPINRSTDHPSRSLSKRQPHPSPKSIPEIWKPSISPEEDARRSFPSRRGSTASMRSTGSGVRPSIAEAIPERVDDAVHLSEKEKERYYETSDTRSPPREKERQPLLNDDRQRTVRESSPLSDEYSSPRSASLLSNRPPESQEGPYPGVASSRPLRHKQSYADDREYSGSQYSQKLRTRTSFTNDRSYAAGPYQAPSSGRPIMRNAFSSDERDRDWDGGGDRYMEPYSPSRTYPTPPASGNRPTAREYSYMSDNYDMRGEPIYREYESHSATWRAAHMLPDGPVAGPYRRSSESRPTLVREPSYSRKRNDMSSPEGRFILHDLETLILRAASRCLPARV